MLEYFVPFVIALVISYALTPSVKKLAIKVGAVDKPNARKVHTHVIPRLGGLAIFIGFMAAVLFCMPINHELLGLLLGCTAIVALGIWDDICNIPAKVKLVGQILAACIPVAFGIQIEWLTNPFGTLIVLPEIIAVPVTIFWIIGFTNTVNLIDGLDGLAAGVSFIASISMFLMAYKMNQYLPAMIIVAMAGAALGFLQYNFNPAKIFMGDTGSMLLGYTMSVAAVLGLVKTAATVALVVPVIALGLPILDTLFAIVRRKMSGVPIFQPDKGHLHHRLLALGLTQKQAVLIMYFVSLILGVVALFVASVNYKTGIVTVLVVLAVIIYSAKRIGILRKTTTNSTRKD
ncbi:MAG: undecaprenyl/decaprenyl-phosphate alpha-N-acetylglucosaminyl 1-phosphate transferase [Megasphaera sp.]|nr:undecaprenyl/decaprenyl-phosphate alpha-N-acetylglucosaminyl 1-phosphate transferase [Megasphaera sp.]MCH4187471.1 undecaprenyl/decaprenyl-phosphate alpha-N-acetylglucosaminyl 1-phosphate transferase [Megasphaera sp.]MCH4217390.1 undecaprenyl/decaprenyl-phosphate alpha-N-acetylglucosaminyl 1-phosphate transferase [Megasphaera sp.]